MLKLNKIGKFFCHHNNFFDKLLKASVAVSLVIFQAVFLFYLISPYLFSAKAHDSTINVFNETHEKDKESVNIATTEETETDITATTEETKKDSMTDTNIANTEDETIIYSDSNPDTVEDVDMTMLNSDMDNDVGAAIIDEETDTSANTEYNETADSTDLLIKEIIFIDSYEFINGPVTIKAQANFIPNQVKFFVIGPKNAEYIGTAFENNIYSFIWNINDGFPEALYKIKAQASFSGKIYNSEIEINYSKENYDVFEKDPEIIEALTIDFVNTFPMTLADDKKIIIRTNKGADKIEFAVAGAAYKKFTGIAVNDFEYYFILPVSDFANGEYELTAGMIIGGEIAAEKTVKINIQKETASDVSLEKPITFFESGIVSTEEKAEETQEETNIEINLNQECASKGIKDKLRCSEYLELAKECKDNSLVTKIQCENYLKLDFKCRELKLNEIACAEFLSLPPECRNAKITTGNECKNYIYSQAMPKECQNAGITDHEDCKKYLEEKILLKECLDAGDFNEKECKQKLSRQAFLPQICLQAGITINIECEKYLKQQKEKEECLAVGVREENKCRYYLDNKYVAKECQELGISDYKECGKALFRKYGIQACAKAGISSEKQCRSFILNKYQQKISCANLSELECGKAIEENFLGVISDRQIKFKELKDNYAEQQEKSQKISELQEKLKISKELIPVADVNVKVKMIAALDDMVLKNYDTLIQTAPLALLIDSDGDGLADDIEERIGTDKNNIDSDGDGYNDGEEVKNGYNPLGSGAIKKALAAIDLAIINNKTIGHPKTRGDVFDNFKINNIANNTEDNKGYILSGQADPNSIVTIYLYSEIPLLVTAKTDAYGNWRYELSESLIDGEHEVYVALNDNTGRVVKKGNPLSFFIKEAKAISVEDFVASAPSSGASRTDRMINLYIFISILTVVIGIMLFVIFIINKKKQEDVEL
ncbi:MAG: Ig-like domain-containing protein [Patescibacteria group bacterium]|nr:Ig-like domain-containing protein [Patescibacteria group bacterium]